MIKRANGRIVSFYFSIFSKIKLVKSQIKQSLLKIKLKIQNILLKIQNYSFYYYSCCFDNYFFNKIRILVSLLCHFDTAKQLVVLEAASPYFSVLFLVSFATVGNDDHITIHDILRNLTEEEIKIKHDIVSNKTGEDLKDKVSSTRTNPRAVNIPPLGSDSGFEFKFWHYYSNKKGYDWAYPENYHTNKDEVESSNFDSVRKYKESGTTYTYETGFPNSKNRYCIIKYPDSTTLKINDPETVYNHILLHRKLVSLSNRHSPVVERGLEGYGREFIYNRENDIYFTSKKKITIESLLNSEYVRREQITINELLNDV